MTKKQHSRWGAKNTDRTYKKSLLQKKRIIDEKIDGYLVGRIQAGSFIEL